MDKSEVDKLKQRAKAATEAYALQQSICHASDTLHARGVKIIYLDTHTDHRFEVHPGGMDWNYPDPDWAAFEAAIHSRLERLTKLAGLV